MIDDQLRRRSVGSPATRSLLPTVLGESVLPPSRAARQTHLRTPRAGCLQTERRGRRSRLSLTDSSRELLGTGAARIYSFGRPWAWDGRWLIVIPRVPEPR